MSKDGSSTSRPNYASWKSKPRIKAYPAAEAGGRAYMGPSEKKPSLPEYEYCLHGEPLRDAPMGGLQLVAGSRRRNRPRPRAVPPQVGAELRCTGARPDFTATTDLHYDSANRPYGVNVIARRPAGADKHYWRIGQWIMPCFTIAPPYGDFAMGSNAWVPRDDESFWRWIISCHPTRPLSNAERAAMSEGKGTHVKTDPETLRPLASRDNDYFIDRAGQKAGKTYNGVYTVGLQDKAMQESQGAIHRRHDEYLVNSDKSIIMVRRRLLDAVARNEEGPPGLRPEDQRIRAASLVADRSMSFEQVSRDILRTREGVPVTSV